MYYVHGDALSSTQLVTDENGNQVARFVYGAWGEELHTADNVPGGTECRFVGGLGVRTDPITGLLLMRFRWYDPGSQRFISRDPIGLAGNSNLYAYTSNPALFTDPMGLEPQKPTIIPRSEWGARNPILENLTLESKTKNTIVIHHQGNSGRGLTYLGRREHMNALLYIQNKHMRGEGGDIGYNFMIDPGGRIYEGRDLKYEAAHVSGANPGKIGILMVGDYNGKENLTLDAEESLCKLLRYLVQKYNLDYTHHSIKAHLQVNDTECPGANIFSNLPRLLKECQQRHQGG